MESEEKESSGEALVTDTDLEDDSEDTEYSQEGGEVEELGAEEHDAEVHDAEEHGAEENCVEEHCVEEEQSVADDEEEKEGQQEEELEEEIVEEDEPCKLIPGSGPKIMDNNRDEFIPFSKVLLEPKSTCDETKELEIEPPPDTQQKVKCPIKSKGEWKNPTRSEMHYYLSTLRLAVPNMSREQDKIKLRRWIFYLLRQVNDKTIRNRYLLLVTLSALSDECLDIVKEEPPSPVQQCIPIHPSSCRFKPARWESDLHWDRLVSDLPKSMPKCPLHKRCSPNAGLEEGVVEAVCGHLMDQEFKYLLFLIRPYIIKLNKREDKIRASMWVQKLASIRPCACAFMKGLRNDYMQALLGYVSLGKCPGPFKRLPPENSLLPLSLEAKKYTTQPILSELSRDAVQDFLSNQRPIDNGAICYVAISGNPKDPNITFSPLDVDFNID